MRRDRLKIPREIKKQLLQRSKVLRLDASAWRPRRSAIVVRMRNIGLRLTLSGCQ